MELREIRTRIDSIQGHLDKAPFVELVSFEHGEGVLKVALTDRFRRRAERAGIWGSDAMLHTLINAGRGFHDERPRSLGGDDGIFVLDRNFRPENVMMKRIFYEFLDRRPAELESILRALRCPYEQLQAVRLVSHHTRLLGVLARREGEDWLVLVDIDPTKLAA